MARRGQVGTLAISGKWHVLRFWKYPANGENRIHASDVYARLIRTRWNTCPKANADVKRTRFWKRAASTMRNGSLRRITASHLKNKQSGFSTMCPTESASR